MHCIIKLISSSHDIMSHSHLSHLFTPIRMDFLFTLDLFCISCIFYSICTIIVYLHTFVTFSIFISLPSHILSFSIFNLPCSKYFQPSFVQYFQPGFVQYFHLGLVQYILPPLVHPARALPRPPSRNRLLARLSVEATSQVSEAPGNGKSF